MSPRRSGCGLVLALLMPFASQEMGTSAALTTVEEPLHIGAGCDFSNYSSLPTSATDPAFRFLYEPGLGHGRFSLHLDHIRLPRNDTLIIRATGSDKDSPQALVLAGRNASGSFYTREIIGTGIIVELFKDQDASGPDSPTLPPTTTTSPQLACMGFSIDGMHFVSSTEAKEIDTWGALALEDHMLKATSTTVGNTSSPHVDESLCGQDESREAVCFEGSAPAVYRTSGPVARLVIAKNNNLNIAYCTGFLVGCEGHMLTNQHCIGTWIDALNTGVEFDAQATQCENDSCHTRGACPGPIRVRSTALVAVSTELDYALIRLTPDDGRPIATLFSAVGGYLRLRGTGPKQDEAIFIPQYPMGWGKRIATTAGGQQGRVESLSVTTCGGPDVGYYLDTQEGSSGSPVISVADNAVVALHHCGGCLNGAIPSTRLIADLELKGVLPRCAVV